MANYLECLASPSTNTVTVPAVTFPAADWEFEIRFRIPTGITGEVNLFGNPTNSNDRFYVSLATGIMVLRAEGVAQLSAAAGIVAGGTYTLKWQRIGTQTRYYCNGTLITTKGFAINLPVAFSLFANSAGGRSRIDFYYAKIISSTVNREWSADGVTSGTVLPELIAASNGTLTFFAGNPWKSEATINTLDNPIPADGAFSGTATGYTAGAATLTTPVIGGGTVSASVTVAAGTDPKAISGTYPPPISTQAYPIMGVSHVHTLTQGATAATQGSVVGAPAGYTITTLNFPVTTNPKYITGNLIVTPVTGDLLVATIPIDPSGFWSIPDPIVAIVIHQILATGVTYIYQFTLGEDGVIGPVEFLSSISASSITASSIIAVGL